MASIEWAQRKNFFLLSDQPQLKKRGGLEEVHWMSLGNQTQRKLLIPEEKRDSNNFVAKDEDVLYPGDQEGTSSIRCSVPSNYGGRGEKLPGKGPHEGRCLKIHKEEGRLQELGGNDLIREGV